MDTITEKVLVDISRGPALPWRPAPAPANTKIFVRSSPAHKAVLHSDRWLVPEIHGVNYEWCPVHS